MTSQQRTSISKPMQMKNRPEKLWLGAPCSDDAHDVWFDPDEGGTEYVRADLYAALEAENACLREALGLFRAFVLNNATTWALGSNHHHPMWAEVAKLLEGFVEPRSGDRWRMVMPATLKTTDAREALKEQS